MTSRVARSPIEVPVGVEINLTSSAITVKGKFGELTRTIHPLVQIEYIEKILHFKPANDSIEANAQAGTMRALANNMVLGVKDTFERKLVMVGVGYRANAQNEKLNLSVGFSHPVEMTMPVGVTVATPSPTEIVIKGADKQQVHQVAANIRAVRPPEPYKGKGIRYVNEHVAKKEAKKK